MPCFSKARQFSLAASWRGLALLLLALSAFSPPAHAQDIAQIVTSVSLAPASLDLIDPENGTSAGSPGTQSRIAVGDVLLFTSRLSPVPDTNAGLQSYLTAYLPPNTELVGVRILDAAGNAVDPRYPGIAVDGCLGGSLCNSFSSLPCSGGTCAFQSGSISQLHADTGVFFADDPLLARLPYSSPISTDNGITMSPQPAAISPSIVVLIGDETGPYFAHNQWDWTQVRAYGVAASVANTGGDGNTPHRYGSPVAGPDVHYSFEATETSPGNIQFNDVPGPWTRVRYPGSTIGVGVGNIGSSSNVTRSLIETTSGYDLAPSTSAAAVAVRVALGETRAQNPAAVELAVRVTALPFDPDVNVFCAEVTGSDISSRGGNSGARDNPWSRYVASPACADVRLQLELGVDKHLVSDGDVLTYSLEGRNLATTTETGVVARLMFDESVLSFISATPPPDVNAPCNDDPALACLQWNVGTVVPSGGIALETHFNVSSSGQAATVVKANYVSDQIPAPGYSTKALTVVRAIAAPEATLATAFDPTSSSATAGMPASLAGAIANTGTETWSQESLTLVLPTGWSVSGAVTLGGLGLSCSSGCGTSRPTYTASLLYLPAQARALSFNVNVPGGTATSLYRVDVQVRGSQSGIGSFETYFPRAAMIPVGMVRTTVPEVTCPVGSLAQAIDGTSEANATVAIRFNKLSRGSATASAGGDWSSTDFTGFGALYGGLEITAVATAPGKLASEPSPPCFVYSEPDCSLAPVASNGGPYCEGETIELSTFAIAGATYSWTGPNGFVSTEQNPSIVDASLADTGTYSVAWTLDGCTTPAGSTDVDVSAGIPNAEGGCDVDADGDGTPDDEDVCINDGAHDITVKPKLQVKKINTDTVPGNDALRIAGEFVSGTPFSQLDPSTTGVRILVVTDDGSVVSDTSVPGGAAWLANGMGTRWQLKDKLGVINGITKIQIQDRSKEAANQVKIGVWAKDGSYPVTSGDEPLNAIVVLGDGALGECGETVFVAGQCAFNGSANSVTCKE